MKSKKGDKRERNKKVVRFGKKKILATAVLVAVIAGMLGGTAIGEKSYFFRKSKNTVASILMDNDRNKTNESKIEDAYRDIESFMNIQILTMGYRPTQMKYKEYSIYEDEAKIDLLYGENIIRMCILKKKDSASLNYGSDRKNKKRVFNKWLNMHIEYYNNSDAQTEVENEATLTIGQVTYSLSGRMPENEFVKILENLNFM